MHDTHGRQQTCKSIVAIALWRRETCFGSKHHTWTRFRICLPGDLEPAFQHVLSRFVARWKGGRSFLEIVHDGVLNQLQILCKSGGSWQNISLQSASIMSTRRSGRFVMVFHKTCSMLQTWCWFFNHRTSAALRVFSWSLPLHHSEELRQADVRWMAS